MWRQSRVGHGSSILADGVSISRQTGTCDVEVAMYELSNNILVAEQTILKKKFLLNVSLKEI